MDYLFKNTKGTEDVILPVCSFCLLIMWKMSAPCKILKRWAQMQQWAKKLF